jgi:hypothetical protein
MVAQATKGTQEQEVTLGWRARTSLDTRTRICSSPQSGMSNTFPGGGFPASTSRSSHGNWDMTKEEGSEEGRKEGREGEEVMWHKAGQCNTTIKQQQLEALGGQSVEGDPSVEAPPWFLGVGVVWGTGGGRGRGKGGRGRGRGGRGRTPTQSPTMQPSLRRCAPAGKCPEERPPFSAPQRTWRLPCSTLQAAPSLCPQHWLWTCGPCGRARHVPRTSHAPPPCCRETNTTSHRNAPPPAQRRHNKHHGRHRREHRGFLPFPLAPSPPLSPLQPAPGPTSNVTVISVPLTGPCLPPLPCVAVEPLFEATTCATPPRGPLR